MDKKFGVKATLEMFDLGFAMVKAIQVADADGKITLLDIPAFIPVFPKLGPAVADIALLPKELGELDEDEEKQVLDYAKTHLPDVSSVELLRAKVYACIKAGTALSFAYSTFTEV